MAADVAVLSSLPLKAEVEWHQNLDYELECYIFVITRALSYMATFQRGWLHATAVPVRDLRLFDGSIRFLYLLVSQELNVFLMAALLPSLECIHHAYNHCQPPFHHDHAFHF